MSKSSQDPQHSRLGPPAAHRQGERGSTLLMLALIIFVFLSASLMFATTQATHAKRLTADFCKLQAIYAAEAGIYAAFDSQQSVPLTTLLTATGTLVQFETLKGADSWLASTGSVRYGTQDYQATARAYVSGNQIVMWEFK